jgi:hypothetical protein
MLLEVAADQVVRALQAQTALADLRIAMVMQPLKLPAIDRVDLPVPAVPASVVALTAAAKALQHRTRAHQTRKRRRKLRKGRPNEAGRQRR